MALINFNLRNESLSHTLKVASAKYLFMGHGEWASGMKTCVYHTCKTESIESQCWRCPGSFVDKLIHVIYLHRFSSGLGLWRVQQCTLEYGSFRLLIFFCLMFTVVNPLILMLTGSSSHLER